MSNETDIERATKILADEGLLVVPDWKAQKYFSDKNINGLGDRFEQRIRLDREVLEKYQAAITPGRSIWERLGAFFSATSTAGRWGKVVRDFVLLLTPYGVQIRSVSEFITERIIKTDQPMTNSYLYGKKPFYKSTTVQGITAALVFVFIDWWGLPLTEAELSEVTTHVFTLISIAVAFIGRLKATQKVGLKKSR